jgi:hypothetical protein
MVAIEQYIKNVENALSDLKKGVEAERIQNQEKTDDELNTILSCRF